MKMKIILEMMLLLQFKGNYEKSKILIKINNYEKFNKLYKIYLFCLLNL